MSNGKSLGKNLLRRLLSVKELSFEEERKRLFFLIATFITSILLISFSLIHFMAGAYTFGLVNLAFFVIAVVSILLCRKQQNGINYYRFVVLMGIFLCLYISTQGETHSYQTLWFFAMPGIVFFMLGKKEGLLASLALLLGLVLILLLSDVISGSSRFEPVFHLRFIACFIVIMAINWSSESMRYRDQQLLENRNQELEADRRRIALTELKMRELAHNDELTGIANRRAILSVLDIKLTNANSRSTLAVGLLDIDHFKNINDTYGHQVGDEVLVELAERIDNMIRKNDMLGRYGGEEFLLLIDNPGNENIQRVFEKIRKVIADTLFKTEAGPLQITVSIGVAIMRNSRDPNELIKDADQALYKAKDNGRDKVELVNS